MKKITILLLLIDLLSFQAQSVMLSCHDPVYKIGYINGIQNSLDDAKKNREKMEVAIGSTITDQQSEKKDVPIQYFNAYNQSNWVGSDVTETSRIYTLADKFEEIQKEQRKGSLFRKAYTSCDWDENTYQDPKIDELLIEGCKKNLLSKLKDGVPDYESVAASINEQLVHPITKVEDPMIKMILVNHSEGTIFGNAFYQDYVLTGGVKVPGKQYNSRAYRFGLYNIATPADYVASEEFSKEIAFLRKRNVRIKPISQNNLYTTSNADWTIGLAPIIDWGKSLPSNVNLGFISFFGASHSLTKTYLAYDATRRKIVKDIKDQFSRLTTDGTAFSVQEKTLSSDNMFSSLSREITANIPVKYPEWKTGTQFYSPNGQQQSVNSVLENLNSTTDNQEYAVSCEDLNLGNYQLKTDYEYFNFVPYGEYTSASVSPLEMDQFYFTPVIDPSVSYIASSTHRVTHYTYPIHEFSQDRSSVLASRIKVAEQIKKVIPDLTYKGRTPIDECKIIRPYNLNFGGLLYDPTREELYCKKHSYPYYDMISHKVVSSMFISKNNGQYYMDISN